MRVQMIAEFGVGLRRGFFQRLVTPLQALDQIAHIGRQGLEVIGTLRALARELIVELRDATLQGIVDVR